MHHQYHRPHLFETIIDALRRSGADVEHLTPEDLLPIDEFHIGGRAETLALAGHIPDLEGAELLDIGCGVGGPMRTLVGQYNCKTTGLDFTFDFCRAARKLALATGIEQARDLVCAAAPHLPFADRSFDVVWMQHTAMNITDKSLLAAEISRVLRPDGRLAVHEVFAGRDEVIHPVFWADSPDRSSLEPADRFQARLHSQNFETLHFDDVTRSAADWFGRVIRRFDERGVPPISLELVVGESFERKARNVARNLTENRITLVQGVFQKS